MLSRRLRGLGFKVPLCDGDSNAGTYITTFAMDGKTQIQNCSLIGRNAIFSAKSINLDTHLVARLCE